MLIQNLSLNKVDKIVAISHYVKNSIVDIYKINKDKITVIHRGIDVDFFKPEINDELQYSYFFSKYNIPTDRKIILFPGRLTKWKGQIEFLDVLQSLDLNNIICYFIGDDKNISYKLKFEKAIYNKNLNSCCKILGHLNKVDVRFMYKSADIIISSPLQPEGFGRIISEGLAMKKIVLCYNFGGPKEQLLGLNDLYAIEPFNKNEIIEKINITLNLSNSEKEQMGDIAREHIQKNFSKKTMLKKYIEFYQQVILWKKY